MCLFLCLFPGRKQQQRLLWRVLEGNMGAWLTQYTGAIGRKSKLKAITSAKNDKIEMYDFFFPSLNVLDCIMSPTVTSGSCDTGAAAFTALANSYCTVHHNCTLHSTACVIPDFVLLYVCRFIRLVATQRPVNCKCKSGFGLFCSAVSCN